MSPTRFTLPFLFFLLVAAGCGWDPQEPQGPVNSCAVDGDCTVGRCEPSVLMCVTDPAAPLLVGLEIRPTTDPHSRTPVEAVTLPPIEVDGATGRDLMMPPVLTAVGQVRVTDATSGTHSIPAAQLTFITASAYGGAPIRTTVTTFEEPMMVGEVQADYAVRLLAGVEYEVIIQPTGDSARDYPPWRRTLTTPEVDPGIAGGLNIFQWDIPYPAELPTVTGTLFSQLPGEMEQRPESMLTVRAVEAETGRIVSSTAISSMGAGDPAEAGRFTIRISPDVGSIFLRVGPSEDRPAFPTIDIDPSGLFESGDPILLQVPRLPIGCFRGRVEAPRPVGTPVADAFVTFHVREVMDGDTGLSGSFTANATSDDDGYFEVELAMPGTLVTYEVTVTPATADEHATLLATQEVSRMPDSGCVMGHIFELPPRAAVGGRVWTPVPGEEVPNVTVEGLPRELPLGGMARNQIVARPADAVTDAEGRYALRLDVGTYDILVKPPDGSRYPWHVAGFEYAIDNPMNPTGLDFTLDHQLEPPVTVSGILRDAAGEPVAAAEIRAFGIVQGDDGDRAVPIARTTTGPDGGYLLLLPPSF